MSHVKITKVCPSCLLDPCYCERGFWLRDWEWESNTPPPGTEEGTHVLAKEEAPESRGL